MKFILNLLLITSILFTLATQTKSIYTHKSQSSKSRNQSIDHQFKTYFNSKIDRMMKMMKSSSKSRSRPQTPKRHNPSKPASTKHRRLVVKHLKPSKNRKSDKKRKLMMGGASNTVVVAPSQGSGIANSQIVVNSLGSPAASPFSGEQAIPAYNAADADPKLIVTRMRMPGNTRI